MKIALLSEKYTPDIGGLAISIGRLGHLLASAGHEVHVFAPTNSSVHKADLELFRFEKQTYTSGGVSVTRFGARKRMDDTLVDWFELVVEEHKHKAFDLLHGYFLPQAGFVAAYAGKYLNIPSVVSIRGNDIERAAFDPNKFSHVMYALQNANAVTTNASELARKAKAFFKREIHLIPNGVDTNHFKPMGKNPIFAETLGLKEQTVIGFAGELREKKGMKTLLCAYNRVNKKQPCALLIVGEVRGGEDRETFDEFQASNPNCQIIVTGVVSHKDMPAYYALMDVFVHPSLRDGMPNALLEAMACEKAVVATPVGGTTDVIEDGINGVLAKVNDADGIAETILWLLSQPKNRTAISRSARETITSKFTLEKELEANLQVYRSLKGNLDHESPNRT
jgi:glycosyltransferase involved in cell wall biosynthesis